MVTENDPDKNQKAALRSALALLGNPETTSDSASDYTDLVHHAILDL